MNFNIGKEKLVMCEASVYILKEGQESLFLADVDVMRPDGDKYYLRSVYGEQKTIKARLKEVSLINHRIILEVEE